MSLKSCFRVINTKILKNVLFFVIFKNKIKIFEFTLKTKPFPDSVFLILQKSKKHVRFVMDVSTVAYQK